jgi:hypothetical protein
MLGRATAEVVSCRLLAAEAQVQSQPVHLGVVVDRVEQGQVLLRVLWFPSVGIILPMVHSSP